MCRDFLAFLFFFDVTSVLFHTYAQTLIHSQPVVGPPQPDIDMYL
jgi:hypothetical protein